MKKTETIKRFTFIERVEIERLLNLGTSVNSIGKFLNRTASGLRQEINKNGGIHLYNASKAQASSLERSKIRYETLSNLYIEKRSEDIKKCLKQGMSLNKIRYFVGISHQTLQKYIKKYNLECNLLPTLEDRISALETQIQILIDHLRKK